MSSRTSLNALAIILTAAGLALIGIATILMLQARPSSPPAGKAADGGPGVASVERMGAANYSASSNAALKLL
jgi:hypothetical protein